MSTPLPGFEGFGEPAGPRGSGGSDGPHGADGPHTAGRFHPTSSDQGHAHAGRREIAPGAVHLPGWLTTAQQRELVTACRDWARGPAPIRHTKLPRGGVMSVSYTHL